VFLLRASSKTTAAPLKFLFVANRWANSLRDSAVTESRFLASVMTARASSMPHRRSGLPPPLPRRRFRDSTVLACGGPKPKIPLTGTFSSSPSASPCPLPLRSASSPYTPCLPPFLSPLSAAGAPAGDGDGGALEGKSSDDERGRLPCVSAGGPFLVPPPIPSLRWGVSVKAHSWRISWMCTGRPRDSPGEVTIVENRATPRSPNFWGSSPRAELTFQ